MSDISARTVFIHSRGNSERQHQAEAKNNQKRKTQINLDCCTELQGARKLSPNQISCSFLPVNITNMLTSIQGKVPKLHAESAVGDGGEEKRHLEQTETSSRTAGEAVRETEGWR